MCARISSFEGYCKFTVAEKEKGRKSVFIYIVVMRVSVGIFIGAKPSPEDC